VRVVGADPVGSILKRFRNGRWAGAPGRVSARTSSPVYDFSLFDGVIAVNDRDS
jgi:hypothetical protein